MKYLIVFFLLAAQIFSQTNTLKGIIRSSEGQPAQYATIRISNTPLIISANEKGEFEIKGDFSIALLRLGEAFPIGSNLLK